MSTLNPVTLTFGGQFLASPGTPLLTAPMTITGETPATELLHIPVSASSVYRVQFIALCKTLLVDGDFAIGVTCPSMHSMHLQATYHDQVAQVSKSITEVGMENATYFSGSVLPDEYNLLIIDGFLSTNAEAGNFAVQMTINAPYTAQLFIQAGAALKLDLLGSIAVP